MRYIKEYMVKHIQKSEISLNKYQRKLLKLLSINCRFTNTDISRSIGVSPDTVDYQIQQLTDSGSLTFHTTVDFRKIGFTAYHYFLRLDSFDRAIVENVAKLPNVTFCNTSIGKFDVQIIFAARDTDEVEECLAQINAEFTSTIKSSALMRLGTELKYRVVLPSMDLPVEIPSNNKIPVYSLCSQEFSRSNEFELYDMDSTDARIIKHLITDPRAPYTEIATHANTTSQTVRNRIKSMVENKFITSFNCFHNFEHHGYLTAIILVSVRSYDVKRFKEFVLSVPQIFYAATLFGTYSSIIYVTERSSADFGKRLDEIREFFSGNVLDYEIIYFDDIVTFTQFPQIALDTA